MENNKKEDPDIVKHFLMNQTKELAIRVQELELRKQEDNNELEYSKTALAVSHEDRESSRQHEFNKLRDRYYFAGFSVLLMVILFIVAITYGKDQIVTEVMKAILFYGAGAFSGYGYIYLNKKNEQS